MEKLVLKGVEFDFDIADADNAESYEKAMQYVLDNIDQKPDGTSNADEIRRQCMVVLNAFDIALGEGASDQLFGKKTNIRICMEGFQELVQAVAAQKESLDKAAVLMQDQYRKVR